MTAPDGYSGYVSSTQATDTEMAKIVIKNMASEFQVKKVNTLGNPIPGVKFAIHEQIQRTDGTLVPNHEPVSGYADLETDANGILGCDWVGLERGTYYLREMSVPDDYIPLNEDICFTLTNEGTIVLEGTPPMGVTLETDEANGKVTYTIKVENSFKAGDLEITKTVLVGDKTGEVKAFTVMINATKNNVAVAGIFNAERTTSAGTTSETVTFDANGEATITIKDGETVKIIGLPAGTEYTVTEAIPEGWTQTTPATDLTGTIPGNGEGTAALVNTYGATGTTVISGKKELTGRKLEAGEFTFELYDEAGNLIESVKNDADGNFSFTALEYIHNATQSDLGEHKYIVKEKKESLSGVAYDETEYAITVTVADNGDGTLSVTATGAENIAFVNTYGAENMIELSGKKELAGRALKEGEFTFELYDGEGNLLQTVTNAADGSFVFKAIGYTLADVANSPFTYTVKEVAGSLTGVVYDVAVYEIEIVVEDNGDGTLKLTKTIKKDGAAAEEVVFSNEYATVAVQGEKTWDDNDNQDGKRPESITIRLMRKVKGSTAEPEEIAVVTVKPDADGKWSWLFEGLPQYAPGATSTTKAEYEYYVTEDPVEGYTTQYDGNNVINSYTPETTQITAVKFWKDNSDSAGKRNAVKATFNLQKTVDGVSTEIDSVEVGKEQYWKHVWKDLPVYENGKKITYSVKEVLTYSNGYKCDTTEWKVVENGGTITITNRLRDDTPGTGDNTKTALWASIMAMSAVGCGGALWVASRKKKKETEQ